MHNKTNSIFNFTPILLIAGVIIINSCTRVRIIDLSIAQKENIVNVDELTINSIQKVGGMYFINYYGDYEDRLNWLDNYHTNESANKTFKSQCSLFAAFTKNGIPILGRNFDRNSEIPVLTRFSAPGKYASFAFSPASEVNLFEVVNHQNPSEEQRNKLLFCLPYYSTDGINEKGLSIAIAGAPPRQINSIDTTNRIFVLHFIRKVLDNCKNVEEVAQFAKTVIPFDSDFNIISHHFVSVDANGKWLVIDYPDGKLHLSLGQDTPQVRTNHFLDGGPAIQDNSFARYDKIYSVLNSSETLESEIDAMNILKQVRNSTKWSVVYESNKCSGIVAINENYKTVYRFGLN